MHSKHPPVPFRPPAYRASTTYMTPFAQSQTPMVRDANMRPSNKQHHPQTAQRENPNPTHGLLQHRPSKPRKTKADKRRNNDFDPEDLPQVIKSYDGQQTFLRLNTSLGEGAFSKCFLLKDESDGKYAAGKFFTRGASSSQKKLERFEREVSIMQALKHPNIVRIYAAISGVRGGRDLASFEKDEHVSFRHAPLLVMEYCSGGSVSSYMRKRRPSRLQPDQKYGVLKPLETLWVAECCARALQHIQTYRLVHRDVKMGNLLLQTNPSHTGNLTDVGIVLCDFGLATQLKDDNDRAKGTAGTPNYMAPEVVSRKGACYASDMWSLGVTIFHCLTGRCPFPAESVEDTYQRIEKNDYRWRSHEKERVSRRLWRAYR